MKLQVQAPEFCGYKRGGVYKHLNHDMCLCFLCPGFCRQTCGIVIVTRLHNKRGLRAWGLTTARPFLCGEAWARKLGTPGPTSLFRIKSLQGLGLLGSNPKPIADSRRQVSTALGPLWWLWPEVASGTGAAPSDSNSNPFKDQIFTLWVHGIFGISNYKAEHTPSATYLSSGACVLSRESGA